MQRFVNDKGSVLASWSSSCMFLRRPHTRIEPLTDLNMIPELIKIRKWFYKSVAY